MPEFSFCIYPKYHQWLRMGEGEGGRRETGQEGRESKGFVEGKVQEGLRTEYSFHKNG